MISYLLRLFKTLTRQERGVFIACVVVAMITGALTIWTTLAKHTTIAPARGGEYTEGVVGQPTAINPMFIGSSQIDRDLASVMFADLATLTDRYATSSTGKVWLVTLKDDMAWSDGKAITSDDVIFTVRTIQHPDAGSPLYASWQGVTVERVSALQVRFTLKAAYSFFPDVMKELRIAPAHIFEDLPITNIRLSDYNLSPVTSGAYSFSSYEKRKDGFITAYHLIANNNYPGERALIERFNFSFFPTYQDALIAFGRKQIDGLGGLTSEQAAAIKINHALHEAPLPQYYALFLNQTAHPALKDKNVREALTLATDKRAIIDEVLGGHARVADGPLISQLAEYSSSTYASEHFSPDEAKALLAKQGWRIGQDGVQVRVVGKNAQRLEFELTVPDLPTLTATADLIKAQWQAIGVKVNIKAVSPETIEEEIIKPRNYQALLFGNILRANSDLYSFWHSSQRFQPGLNFALYSNPAVDKLIEAARSSFDDAVRTSALVNIQEQLRNDRPAIFLYSPLYLYVAPTDLGGFDRPLIASPADRLRNVNEWYLKTARVFKAATSTTE